MAKNVIWNVLLNLAIVLLILVGYSAYVQGNALVLGLCIAFGVLVIYLKVVLMKHVRRSYADKKVSVNLKGKTKKRRNN